ncbi:Gfo/Idh/MocA family protein [Sphingomonas radiodurans]|uniref:Gfo/Idh/MocA family protein n=1 Tax=Sphingomonas radiodurans TaxID=2890321 RepID=UPI001E5B67FD|nr:Gfo/Idh/MocA family oxidoreductase [Sphingomonas radiodurans]WBH18157.1 Gfo/Idh/MocA family oxidoreductase [Sphingomonas radiodurans]
MIEAARPPRVGFLGVGWIGRHRMAAIADTGLIEVAAISDPSPEMQREAAALAPAAIICESLDDLLAHDLDGLVIATPSALHAEQSIRALHAGVAVFCQKPLGRTAREVRAVVDAGRTADRLLAVDLSYRFTAGMARIADLVRSGALGRVHAIDLTFHNAYGPDKPWFYDRALSGGGCVMDLGVHLVDLALWAMDFPALRGPVTASLTADGAPIADGTAVEDFAVASFALEDGPVVRLACSWRLHAGREADIAAIFYGTDGGAALRNVDGSFYDFTAELYRGTSTETLTSPPDDWGGRAAADWATRLAAGARFDPAAERLVDVAHVLDRIYAAA